MYVCIYMLYITMEKKLHLARAENVGSGSKVTCKLTNVASINVKCQHLMHTLL